MDVRFSQWRPGGRSAVRQEAHVSRSPSLLVSAVLVAGLGAAFVGQARACECTGPQTLDVRVARSSAVFTGKVLAIQPSANPQYQLLVVAPVLRWKGGLTDPVIVADPNFDGICMFHATVGTEYLFFTDPGGVVGPAPEAGLYVTSCSGSAPSQDNPDVLALGAPLMPTPTLARSWWALKRSFR